MTFFFLHLQDILKEEKKNGTNKNSRKIKNQSKERQQLFGEILKKPTK